MPAPVRRLDIPIKRSDPPYGIYANAFRVLDSTDGECLLDFLVYSGSENRAVVTARIKVPVEMLGVIHKTLVDLLLLIEEPRLRLVASETLH